MVRRPFPTMIVLLAGALCASAAAAHPGGGGGGGHASAPAAMGHSNGAGLGPGSAPGNFGATSQAENPLASITSSRSNQLGQIRRASIEERGDTRSGEATRRDGASGRTAVTSASTPATLSNAKLDAALTRTLTKSGVTLPPGGLKSACQGFASVGQCVSALHVAQNLSIPGGFPALKAAATAKGSSLGQAIHELAPSPDARVEARKADHQADADIEAAEG